MILHESHSENDCRLEPEDLLCTTWNSWPSTVYQIEQCSHTQQTFTYFFPLILLTKFQLLITTFELVTKLPFIICFTNFNYKVLTAINYRWICSSSCFVASVLCEEAKTASWIFQEFAIRLRSLSSRAFSNWWIFLSNCMFLSWVSCNCEAEMYYLMK